MHRGIFITACLLGALSVVLGAFGAHSLKNILSVQQLVTFETAVRYQFYHVFALMFVALLYPQFSRRLMLFAGWSFISGIILFCGSLYLLTYVQVSGLAGSKWLGPVTPVGGLAFITGWIMMAVAAIKKN